MDKKDQKEIEKAQKILQEAEIEKQRKCYEELKPILDKYGYELGTTQPNVIFISKQK